MPNHKRRKLHKQKNKHKYNHYAIKDYEDIAKSNPLSELLEQDSKRKEALTIFITQLKQYADYRAAREKYILSLRFNKQKLDTITSNCMEEEFKGVILCKHLIAVVVLVFTTLALLNPYILLMLDTSNQSEEYELVRGIMIDKYNSNNYTPFQSFLYTLMGDNPVFWRYTELFLKCSIQLGVEYRDKIIEVMSNSEEEYKVFIDGDTSKIHNDVYRKLINDNLIKYDAIIEPTIYTGAISRTVDKLRQLSYGEYNDYYLDEISSSISRSNISVTVYVIIIRITMFGLQFFVLVTIFNKIKIENIRSNMI